MSNTILVLTDNVVNIQVSDLLSYCAMTKPKNESYYTGYDGVRFVNYCYAALI
jgi:hypothetical protein